MTEVHSEKVTCEKGYERLGVLADDGCHKCEDERGWRILLGIMAPGMALFVVVTLFVMDIAQWMKHR